MNVGPSKWAAKWIWLPGEGYGHNLYRQFRKTLSLGSKPSAARLFITADSSFRLFVNGEFVHRGPARCAPEEQAYDILDIAELLHRGKNVLAVLAHHNGVPTALHGLGRPGFLCQLEVTAGGKTQIFVSDASWRVNATKAWNANSPQQKTSKGGGGGNLSIGAPLPPNPFGRGFIEEVILSLIDPTWTATDFDDSKWVEASIVSHAYGWPTRQDEPGANVRPWITLVPRDLPYLKETLVRAANIHSTSEVIEYEKLHIDNDLSMIVAQDIIVPLEFCKVSGTAQWKSGRGPLILHNSDLRDENVIANGIRSVRVILDLGDGMNGHARLDIEGSKGAIVDITYGPHLVGNQIAVTLQGARNVDRLILSGGRDVWEAEDWRFFRYMGITVRDAVEPVRLHWAGMTRIEYPFEEKGRFSSDSSSLDALWKAGAKTVRIVTTDAYQDNYREQLHYHQTGYYSTRANWAAFGDPYLQRRLLIQGSQAQAPSGLMPPMYPGTIPGKTVSSIIESNLFYICQFHDYLLRSGDFETARLLAPVVERVLNRFERYENGGGAIEDCPFEYWIDHSPLDRRGANLCFNGFYIMALEDAAEAFAWLGLGKPEVLLKRADRVRSFLRKRLWSARDGLFVDSMYRGRRSEIISEHSNAMALYCGVANEQQIPSIVKMLRPVASPHVVPVSPLFMYYVVEGLFKVGMGQRALEILERRFRHVLEAGHGTLWEDWCLIARKSSGSWRPASRCLGQAESAFPPDSLSRWVLGVWPAAPGMSRIDIRYCDWGLKKVSGTVPTPRGVIELAWDRRPNALRFHAVVPDGTIAVLDLASIGSKGEKFRMNGKVCSSVGPSIELSAGEYAAQFPTI